MTSHVLTINRTRTQAHDNSGMSELSPTKIKPDRSNRTLTSSSSPYIQTV